VSQWPNPKDIAARGEEPMSVLRDPSVARDLPGFVPRMQYMDMATYLPDDILTKVDRVSMSVSLEVRVPLLDHRVVEFSAKLPAKLRVKDGKLKYIFRKAMEGLLPPEILARKKKGFSIPQSEWLESGLVNDGRSKMRGPARMALWLLDQWSGGSWLERLKA
jgi:asparagine synthase (glutamine-hydrolysing)